jgi:SAM-dependent methyltransferase
MVRPLTFLTGLITLILTGSIFSAETVKNRVEPQEQNSLAPFVPTPQDVVNRMLQLAGVTSQDVVYDLGCGDGRIVITAAERFGARGVGIDFDPQRIAEANANADRAGVSHLVTFIEQDAMLVDVSDATVVTLYLLSSSNLKLRPRLTQQLKAGARIVSHAFSMGDWTADQIDEFTDERGNTRRLFLWRHDGTVRP